LTSTFLPTRDAKSLALPVSLYVALDVPLVAVGLGLSVGLAGFDAPADGDTSVKMNPAAAELAPGLAGAPGEAAALSAFKHPVTVTVCAVLLLLLESC